MLARVTSVSFKVTDSPRVVASSHLSHSFTIFHVSVDQEIAAPQKTLATAKHISMEDATFIGMSMEWVYCLSIRPKFLTKSRVSVKVQTACASEYILHLLSSPVRQILWNGHSSWQAQAFILWKFTSTSTAEIELFRNYSLRMYS